MLLLSNCKMHNITKFGDAVPMIKCVWSIPRILLILINEYFMH